MASALILIDIQNGFDAPFWGARNNPDAEANAARLLQTWRAWAAPVCHIKHVSTEIGSPLGPGDTIKTEVAPQGHEPVFEKSVNSAFIGTELEDHLTHASVGDLVICGLTTPHCVSTTARMAANLGFAVRLAHDACAAFAINARVDWKGGGDPPEPQAIHDAALSHLHGEFARVLSTDEILREGP